MSQQLELLTIDEFYKFASKIAKRDKRFIGGFLGAVYEEWKETHALPKQIELPCGCMAPARSLGELCPSHRRGDPGKGF